MNLRGFVIRQQLNTQKAMITATVPNMLVVIADKGMESLQSVT
ncbi:hypothetical protein VCR15J5_560131 [Vibrio crassostreae]|nr:hypothetical protein VCR15J5_560131 [Vibrio crassostreae]